MQKVLSDYFDTVVLVACLGLAIVNIGVLSMFWGKHIVASRQDKTALDVRNELDFDIEVLDSTYGEKSMTVREMVMSFLTVDDGVPYPKTVKITSGGDTQTYTINADWVANKYNRFKSIYTHFGLKSKLGNTVTVRYEKNNCWHYTING